MNGYHAGLQEVGLKPIYLFPPPTHTGEDLFQQGRAMAKNMVHMETRPDAVQAYSDPLAMGFVEGMKELGLRVPHDVAVVGFDDRKMAVLMSPRLTTMAHPNIEVGEADGDIRTLVEDLLDCGVEVLNLQDRVNGLDWSASHLKGRVCVDLDIHRQNVTRFGTPVQIDSLIREAVAKLGSPQGGLMLCYGLYPGTPLENARAVMDAMETYSEFFN